MNTHRALVVCSSTTGALSAESKDSLTWGLARGPLTCRAPNPNQAHGVRHVPKGRQSTSQALKQKMALLFLF